MGFTEAFSHRSPSGPGNKALMSRFTEAFWVSEQSERSHGAEKRKPTGRIKGLLRGDKVAKIRHRKGRRRKKKKKKEEEEEEGKTDKMNKEKKRKKT